MKKLAVIYLALILCSLPVLGQGAGKRMGYTHPTHGFSLRYPSDWLLVDAFNLDAYIAAYQAGTMKHGAADAETLSYLAPLTKEYNSTWLMDIYGNYAVIDYYPVDYTMTPEQFAALVLPQVRRSMEQHPYYQEAEFLTDGEIVTYRENTYALLAVNVKDNGGVMTAEDSLYLLNAGNIFEIQITSYDLFSTAQDEFYAEARKMLASVTLPPVQE